MTWLFAVQFAAPLILIGWLVWVPARSGVGFVVQVFGNFAALAVMALQGIWLLPPWWAPYVFAVASPLESIRAPTLVISARDDRYGTYASAQYTAGRITGAKFIGFDEGGHTWVGHDDEVRAAIVELLVPSARP